MLPSRHSVPDVRTHTDWKWRDGKNIPCKGNQNKAGVAIFTHWCKVCNKRQPRALHNDKQSLQQEDIPVVNVYAPNIGAPKYIQQANRPKRRDGKQYSSSRGS